MWRPRMTGFDLPHFPTAPSSAQFGARDERCVQCRYRLVARSAGWWGRKTRGNFKGTWPPKTKVKRRRKTKERKKWKREKGSREGKKTMDVNYGYYVRRCYFPLLHPFVDIRNWGSVPALTVFLMVLIGSFPHLASLIEKTEDNRIE